MGREFERKYGTNPQILEQIREKHGDFTKIEMETIYFDTPAGALSARKMTLRLRRENGVCVCTLKTPLPDGSRGEWEWECDDLEQGLSALTAAGAPAVPERPLMPVCGARFTRLCKIVPTADGTAELALDSGVLMGGGRESLLCEMEVELKSGSEEAAVALANELAARYGLSEEPRSKFARAMSLAKGE